MDQGARARTENSFEEEDARDLHRQGHEAHGRSPAPEGSRDGALARPPALTGLSAKRLSLAEGNTSVTFRSIARFRRSGRAPGLFHQGSLRALPPGAGGECAYLRFSLRRLVATGGERIKRARVRRCRPRP